MEESQKQNWLDKEAETLGSGSNFTGEKLPAMKFVENKISTFDVDFSKPFDKYDDDENKSIKAIIPVTESGEKKIWWCNIKNPVYAKVIHAGRTGQTQFKLMQIGSKKATRYELVDDVVPTEVVPQTQPQ